MDSIRFEWDARKDAINRQKHHVSFDEAKTVFEDEDALVIADPEHSVAEERFIIVPGFSRRANLLVVCRCYRASDAVIRLISARKATANECRQYHSFGNGGV